MITDKHQTERDFADELSDEALDRGDRPAVTISTATKLTKGPSDPH